MKRKTREDFTRSIVDTRCSHGTRPDAADSTSIIARRRHNHHDQHTSAGTSADTAAQHDTVHGTRLRHALTANTRKESRMYKLGAVLLLGAAAMLPSTASQAACGPGKISVGNNKCCPADKPHHNAAEGMCYKYSAAERQRMQQARQGNGGGDGGNRGTTIPRDLPGEGRGPRR